MKIAYILDDDISTRTGVANKIDLITTQWRSLGHDVKVFSLRSKGENSIIDNGVIISQFKANISIVQKLIDQFKNIKLLKKILEDYSPDIIYIRNMKYYPGIVNALRGSSNYVVEINSKDLEESRQNSYLVYLYNLFTRGIFLKNARAFVAVSNELKNDSSFSKYSKECLVVANGYNFGIVKESKKVFNDTINFVFIATPNQSWHGVEKIIKLSKILNKNKFHIIGYNEEQLRAVDNTYNDNVITYGYLKHDEAEKLIVQCDIGISSLALYKNSMEEASPLKSRQYLALGLPMIIGYNDTDISNDKEYILDIGNYQSNIEDNIDKIKLFMQSVKSFNADAIIQDAKEILDYKNKEKLRVKYLENLK